MVTPRKTTEITEITEMEMIIQFINSSKMQYINKIRYYKSSAPKMQKLEKGTKASKTCPRRCKKHEKNPHSDAFSSI